jgi:hypothetical protein
MIESDLAMDFPLLPFPPLQPRLVRLPRATIARGCRSFPIEYKAGLLRKARNSLHRQFKGHHEPQSGHPHARALKAVADG